MARNPSQYPGRCSPITSSSAAQGGASPPAGGGDRDRGHKPHPLGPGELSRVIVAAGEQAVRPGIVDPDSKGKVGILLGLHVVGYTFHMDTEQRDIPEVFPFEVFQQSLQTCQRAWRTILAGVVIAILPMLSIYPVALLLDHAQPSVLVFVFSGFPLLLTTHALPLLIAASIVGEVEQPIRSSVRSWRKFLPICLSSLAPIILSGIAIFTLMGFLREMTPLVFAAAPVFICWLSARLYPSSYILAAEHLTLPRALQTSWRLTQGKGILFVGGVGLLFFGMSIILSFGMLALGYVMGLSTFRGLPVAAIAVLVAPLCLLGGLTLRIATYIVGMHTYITLKRIEAGQARLYEPGKKG